MVRSEQLEHEAEQTWADLARTLDALRDRISPGQILDRAIDYAREGEGAELVGNLRRQVVENPLPLGLMGIALGWLMWPGAGRNSRLGAATGRVSAGAERTADGLAERAAAAADSISQTSEEIGARAGAMTESMSRTANGISEQLGDGYAQAAGFAAEASRRAGESASSVGRGLRDARNNFLNACREQPLILAGLGLALGAAFGAALPRTESEDRLMGEPSQQLKDKAQEMAAEQIESAKSTAQREMERVKDVAEAKAGEMQHTAEQQLTPDTAATREGSETNGNQPVAAAANSDQAPSIVPYDETGPATSDLEVEHERR